MIGQSNSESALNQEQDHASSAQHREDMTPRGGIEVYDHFTHEPNTDVGSGETQTRDQTGAFGFNGGSAWVEAPPTIVFASSLTPPVQHFEVEQKWEGYVIDREGDHAFLARLKPKEGEGPDQIMKILISEVPGQDQSLIRQGALFYWSIGYLRDEAGTIERHQAIRFRRLPGWTQKNLEDAAANAERLRSLLDVD